MEFLHHILKLLWIYTYLPREGTETFLAPHFDF